MDSPNPLNPAGRRRYQAPRLGKPLAVRQALLGETADEPQPVSQPFLEVGDVPDTSGDPFAFPLLYKRPPG